MDQKDADRIRENYGSVLGRIRAACERSMRSPRQVTLVAVTKTVQPEHVRVLYELGHRDFGENRVQELERKCGALSDLVDINWHMIGHLQRNKVRKVLPLCAMIHSVDSMRLAAEIDKRAGGMRDLPMPVFLEINVSGEESKWGLEPEEALDAVDELTGTDNLLIRGLMTMAPFTDDMDVCRGVFQRLAALQEELRAEAGDRSMPLDALSMGMTQDFEVAVEEGATHVRVGSALFEGTSGKD